MKINGIHANKDGFKETIFNDDWSIILADVTEDSTDKDSRNGLGKTLLVEIINFCLGSNISNTLEKEELAGWSFSLDVEVNGDNFVFDRAPATQALVTISGDLHKWPIKTSDEYLKITVEDFKKVLGIRIFGITHQDNKPGQLSYRNLMSYFMRSDPTAFVDPFKYASYQKALPTQMANAYLLGLNDDYSYKFSEIEKKKKLLGDLQKAATSGMLDDFTGNMGELEAEKVRVSEKLESLKQRVAAFRVHDEYYEIQDEADVYTNDIHQLLNEINLHEKAIEQYEENIKLEHDISVADVESIYQQAGVYFNEQLKKKLDEVQAFHKTVVENRAQYLKDEIKRLRGLVSTKRKLVAQLSGKKESAMAVLNSHGALDEFSQLQNRVSSIQHQFDDVNNRIEKLVEFNNGMSKIAIEIEQLKQAMTQDYSERRTSVDEAIKIFNSNSEALYSEPGTLSINITSSGYKFGVKILRASSGGVTNMKVFCYDLLIAELSSRLRGRSIPLIHDSRIFDGVDERQIAKALKLAYKKSTQCGFQYICTINSDDVPYHLFDDEFRKIFDNSVVLRYSDSEPSGTLLGFRF
ncbi:MAG TPA: DUF2326 domain-containing protein [Candidatus Saccharibacteria bacterium]|nr:DUF2326 domain-containing protein [Candidatus Saccharibacteria bacterium]